MIKLAHSISGIANLTWTWTYPASIDFPTTKINDKVERVKKAKADKRSSE